MIREKISKELCKQSSVLAREILDIKVGTNETIVYFRNGSTIQAINALIDGAYYSKIQIAIINY
ncbi:MAG: hypothetical protein RRZ84_09330 [Romboutsia sp.]